MDLLEKFTKERLDFTTDRRHRTTSERILVRTQDNRGNIYIGTRDNRIYRVNKGVDFPLTASFRKMRFNGVDIPDKITHVHWANGKLWFANPSGVFGFIGEDQAIVQGAKSGTLRNILTKDNHIWIGTADEGVLHYVLRNDSLISFRSLNTENDLMSNNVYQLLGDEIIFG